MLIGEKTCFFSRRAKKLDYFFIFMPKNLFCESFVTIQCTIENKTMITTLANTCATRYDSIYAKFGKVFAKLLKLN